MQTEFISQLSARLIRDSYWLIRLALWPKVLTISHVDYYNNSRALYSGIVGVIISHLKKYYWSVIP